MSPKGSVVEEDERPRNRSPGFSYLSYPEIPDR
jgi:hypothetical protein